MQFIRVKTINDVKIVENLAQQIWTHHYQPIIGLEQVEYMLNNFQNEKAIFNQIKQDFEYYLINRNDNCGYLSVQNKENELYLSKLYVLNTIQGIGIGKACIQFIKQRAKELNCNKITLQVNKYNANSISFYQKQGFEIIKPIVVDIGNGYIMDDYWMEKQIES